MADDDLTISGSELGVTLDGLSTRTRGLTSGANSFASAITQAFSQAAVGGKRFDDVLKSLALRLSDLSLKLALKPLTKSLVGGIDSLFGNLLGTGGASSAKGDEGLIAALGGIKPFADGGVIASPRYFPLGGGGVGLAGEAGPEAILPLARGPDGKLGVAAGGGAPSANVTINISTPDAASFRRSEAYVTGLVARAVARGQRSL